ncbi:hypothetical protein AMTR_s00019p00211120 [Amborella trichopoda]|uniref:Peptidase S8/S53 domain-containing protein n=2 Tax=Amborella trichopoda TaxID=13333 RepID=W1PBK5_AMBTC|nr:hypothetical protein AMTR_s00019p00211120 [Amborella trichopoda]
MHILLLPLLLSLILRSTQNQQPSNPPKTFIILSDGASKPTVFPTHTHWFKSMASSINPPLSKPFIHTYSTLFRGFSAALTKTQLRHIKKMNGVLAVFPDETLQLHTTRSPEFIGLCVKTTPICQETSRLLKISKNGSESVIGILDTGIWPEHPSFQDQGLDPIPSHFKGHCQDGQDFNKSHCNRKLIGAKYFSGGYETMVKNLGGEILSARDYDGHGTHVASIAAGRSVSGAGFYGFAGVVSGGVAPESRISVYKVCWFNGCLLSDIVKAFDEAVKDGVNVISMSLGSLKLPFYMDLIAISAFRASEKGISVIASAGNEGPEKGSVSYLAPWITTVGAGTIDRDFPASVKLGNGKIIKGQSLTPQSEMPRKNRRLLFFGKITSHSHQIFRNSSSLKGSIVICYTGKGVSRSTVGMWLKSKGAVAMIISHEQFDPLGLIAEPHVLPTITIPISAIHSLKSYLSSSLNPTATIFSKGTALCVRPAPILASFSCRGPNQVEPTVLKPDLMAPGVNILGSWTPHVGPTNLVSDTRVIGFNIQTGTSMACPHVSGAVSLLKAAHPSWSPGTIKSALMTTARVAGNLAGKLISDESSGQNSGPLGIGSGFLQPEKALDPGLVYDLEHEDYTVFLCGLNYSPKQIRLVVGKWVDCGVGSREKDYLLTKLNYPAVVMVMGLNQEWVGVRRRVRNVGSSGCKYRARVVGLSGFDVEIRPKRLRFRRFGERLEYEVGVKRVKDERGNLRNFSVGWFKWEEEGGQHIVRSPVLVLEDDFVRGILHKL